MPIAEPAQDALNTLGFESVLEQIEAGRAQTEIAKDLRIHVSGLNRWLHADPHRSARVQIAMRDSAEAWVDRGMQYLLDAPSDNAEIQRARALEQTCARRAAIRNPRYRDNVSVEHTGQVEVRSITRRIIDTALPMVEQVQQQLPPHAHTRAVLDSTEHDLSLPDTAADK